MPKETTKDSIIIKRLTNLSVLVSLGLLAFNVQQQVQEKHRIEQAVDCDINDDITNQELERIDKCKTYMFSGKIAVIGFDTTQSELSYIVKNTQQELKTLFGAAPSLQVVAPTNELSEEYDALKEISGTGQVCISNEHFLSDIARERMDPLLQTFNAVVAYTSLPGCEDNYKDYPSKYYASAAYSARSGDITAFKLTDRPEDIEMMVHEIGHSLGLQHTGTLQHNLLPAIVANKRVDEINISEVIASAQYNEYGEKSTIMGSGYSKKDFPNTTKHYPYVLNTLQQQIINALVGKPLLPEVRIAKNSTSILHTSRQQIITIDLENAIELHDKQTENTHEFPVLTIVSKSSTHPGIKEENRLELYGKNGSLTVFLGYIVTDDTQERTTILHFDNQDITIHQLASMLRIESKTL
jgi:hypothetical protein